MKAKTLTKETVLDYGIEDRGFPSFNVGDTVSVAQRVKEGDKERTQLFQGDVIGFHRNGVATTFTVRRIGANNVAVERIYPYYSPNIQNVTVVKHGDVRRAKLYYVRDRVGKAARISEKVLTKAQKETAAE